MNTPNKLTLARMIATPFFMAAMLFDFPYHYTVSFVIFVAASLTDMIDGKMARKYNLITDFGKFLDPLADKMLTVSAFLGFIKMGIGWQVSWIAFIVIFREFAISSLRLIVVKTGGKVIAANIWGKLKTVTQMAGISIALFAYALISDFGITAIQGVSDIIISILFWASAVLCIISGVIYFMGCKEYIDPTK